MTAQLRLALNAQETALVGSAIITCLTAQKLLLPDKDTGEIDELELDYETAKILADVVNRLGSLDAEHGLNRVPG